MTTMFNNATQSVAANGTYALTNVANQKGCSTKSGTNGINIVQSGIYEITATVTGFVTAGGIVNIAVQENGSTIAYLQGQSYSNTGEPTTITLSAPIVVNPNCCAVTTNLPATITIANIGNSTVSASNVSLSVVKI